MLSLFFLLAKKPNIDGQKMPAATTTDRQTDNDRSTAGTPGHPSPAGRKSGLSRSVPQQGRLFTDTLRNKGARTVQEGVQTAQRQSVIDVGAALFAAHHARLAQYRQMPRYGGHVRPGKRLQIADALFPVTQGLHHEQTAGMPQSLENFGLLGDILSIGACTHFIHIWQNSHVLTCCQEGDGGATLHDGASVQFQNGMAWLPALLSRIHNQLIGSQEGPGERFPRRRRGSLPPKYVVKSLTGLKHFRFERLCASNHTTAWRFTEKTLLFRSLLAGMAVSPPRVFPFSTLKRSMSAAAQALLL